MGPSWYVVRTEPNAERLAENELIRDGFETFLPRITNARTGLPAKEQPLFPGYLFLRVDPSAEVWPVFRPGQRILGWLNFGGEVPSLPDPAVAELKQRVDVINHEGGLRPRFKPGQIVQVVSQSLQGLAQVIEDARSPKSRVKVLLEFMGRSIAADVGWESLRPVEDTVGAIREPNRRTRGRGRWIKGSGDQAGAGA